MGVEQAPGPATVSGGGWLSSAVEAGRKVRGQSRAEWARLAWLTLQFALVVLCIERFQVASRAFSSLSWLALGGFVVHALLPLRLRPACFCLLSVAGIFLVLSPLGLASAAWLLALGLAIIGLCHLPVGPRSLIGILLVAGAGLAAMRAGWIVVPWKEAIWPVLGSMFMFRTMIFLYDRRHGERSRSFWETCGYFFLLPNVCFPLFPVVDYKTHRRSWYAEDELDCYQTGVRWMLRGLLQLLFYRFVYYYVLLAPSEVSSVPELVQYVTANFGLYLRVSGTFHLVVGMCRMFGFALPETNFLYFLSTSVNDFWRRANIYWKDFMLKVWYIPAYFRLRKGGEARALVVATLLVVLVTWLLHSYQVFWLSGTFPVRWQDGVFWTFLGTFMIVNTLSEQRKSGARGRRARTWSVSNAWGQTWRIALTFSALATLWSLWTCSSFEDWLSMWRLEGSGVEGAPLHDAWVVLPALLVVLALEGAAGRAPSGPRRTPSSPGERLKHAAWTTASLAALLLFATPSLYGVLGERFSATVQSMRVTKLNRLDAAKLQRGYYEELLDVDQLNSELSRVLKSKPKTWLQLHETFALRARNDFLLSELTPSSETEYKGATLRINSFGMRDREYALEKPPGTYRIALLGASYVMGSGVENEQTFEALMEDDLNAADDGRRYEILNFAVGGYSPMQRMATLERSLDFAPDMALYIAHENEAFRIERHLVAARERGIEVPWEELRALLAASGIDPTLERTALEQALAPHLRRILGWTYRRMADICREKDIRPVWVLLPTLEMYGTETDIAWMLDLAREAGFDVISLFDAYDGADIFDIRVAPWDYHPNQAGHRLVAERLLGRLRPLID